MLVFLEVVEPVLEIFSPALQVFVPACESFAPGLEASVSIPEIPFLNPNFLQDSNYFAVVAVVLVLNSMQLLLMRDVSGCTAWCVPPGPLI